MRRSRVLALLLLAMLALAGVAAAAKKEKEKEAVPDEDDEELGEADFWGVEVAAGKKVKVALADELDQSVHITQVALGPKAKPGPHVVSLEVNGQRHYIGTVDKDSNPAFTVDLHVDDTFQLRHTGDSTVYVTGTYSNDDDSANDDDDDDDDDDEETEVEDEFWGVEVKPGKKVTVKLLDADDSVLHLTQFALGPKPKAGDAAISLEVNGGKFFVGTLNKDKNTEFGLDLPIDDTFTIRHTGESSVFVTGYAQTIERDEQDDEEAAKKEDDAEVNDEDEDGDGEPEADFWGVEVPANKKVTIERDDAADEVIHIRNLALGPSPKAGPSTVSIEVNGKTFFIGTLDKADDTELKVDLVVDDTFTLRHTGPNTIYVTGYTGELEQEDDEFQDTDGDGDDDLEVENEFWGVVVQPNKKVTVQQKDEADIVTRITQVALGPKPKQGAAVVSIETNGKSTVIGTLNRDGETSFSCNLPIDDTFTIRHTGNNAVFLTGYTEVVEDDEQDQADDGDDDDDKKKGGDDDDDDDDDELEKETEFWALEVGAGKKATVSQKDEDDITTHITQIALGPKAKKEATVSIDVHGQTYYLATLHKDKLPQLAVDVAVDDTFTIRHTGDGEVFLSGYTEVMEPDEDNDEDGGRGGDKDGDGEDDGDDDKEDGGGDDDDDDDDDEPPPPPKKGKKGGEGKKKAAAPAAGAKKKK